MANIYIDFQCVQQDLARTDENTIAEGVAKVLHARFDLCSKWDGLALYARFKHMGAVYDVPIVDGCAEVPHEVVKYTGFEVSIFGEDAEGGRLTSAKVFADVKRSIEPEGVAPLPATPSQIDLFIAKAAAAEAAASNAAASAAAAEESAKEAAESAASGGGGSSSSGSEDNGGSEHADDAAASAEAAAASASEAAASAESAQESARTAAVNTEQACNAAAAAQTAEANASTYAENARVSADDAAVSAADADEAFEQAAAEAVSAEGHASNAAGSATEASASASTAASKATEAAGSAESAANAKTAAETAQGAAETAANTATSKASAANTSATNAAGSASAAASSEANAKTSETNAAASASDASESATAAANSADDAAEMQAAAMNYAQQALDNTGVAVAKAEAAAASASAAKTSETNAASSASAASSSASAAKASETNAANSAATATNKATAAADSATAAAASADEAQAAAELVLNSTASYVQTEAERVSAVVQGHQGANTVTFLACSDIHHSTVNNADQMAETLAHLGQGMALIRESVAVDFAVCLGDSIWDASNESVDNVLEAQREVNAALFDAFNGIPNFRLIGNHEAHYNGSTKLTAAQIFASTAAFNAGAVFDEANRAGGYCYRDFEAHKLRVVCLNTSEADETGSFVMSSAQLEWLASALNLASLGDGWKSVILSHIPLDWYGANSAPLSIVAAADGVLCNVHGHIHNYLAGTLEGTDVPRFAIPNGCFYRSNEYGENDSTEYNGMEFGEDTTYGKTAGTAEDTAFCVVTLDLENLIAYADHYGAGYDREITLLGESAAGEYTNLVPTALDFDLDGVFNGVGYMDGKYISTSAPYYNTDASTVTTGLIPYENTNADGAYITPPTIYVKGVTIDTTNGHNRLGVSRPADAGAIMTTPKFSELGSVLTIEELGTNYYKLTPIMDDSGQNAFYEVNNWIMGWIAFSFTGTGENLIITLDEPIED